MDTGPLRLGRIAYLNVWPLYESLIPAFPEGPDVAYVPGHPSALNAALAEGRIDAAPASAFAYLARPDAFTLLPGLCIRAAVAPIRSVLLLSPVPLAELPGHLRRTGDPVLLSGASASSNALVRVLWRFAWKFPEARFEAVPPGTGLPTGKPFVEIGDLALGRYLDPPAGWHVTDLGQAWFDYAATPFVFALWIVRQGLAGRRLAALARLHEALLTINAGLPEALPRLVGAPSRPEWIDQAALLSYLRVVNYDLDAPAKASLILFAEHCREMGLVEAVPGLRFAL
ncbi:MAG: menaquinone biosynthesis protein [Solidesulfovibrio sp.]|uniref:menaquinone biosynthetic enzyme MqnA/MqnD family protein n=1 Tax=Solidesulfovibrio sp. TaxID=2910990 RepID=UPI002B208918|nr:menaquinone biosynthesis protein [Solidesulfovibrio sp.]MEA4858566.1 menaquinone biosynthesis protein [Solidesulfovibrio sp.]